MKSRFALVMLSLIVLSGMAQAQSASSDSAQSYPTKPVRILIGFSAGSSTDTVARIIAPKLSESWGRPVVLDNRPGAAGNIAADATAKATPDGYTLLFTTNGVAISRSLYPKLSYDALRDLEPITQVTAMPHVLVVTNALPVQSVKDLIALAKSTPRQLNFASAGTGGSDHMAGELFKYVAGVDIVHVPYKGSPQALTDTVAGEVAMYFAGLPLSMGMVKAGKVKALGTSGTKRSSALPNVPTIAEAGLPGYEMSLWFGLLAPARTPKEIVAKIAADTGRALKAPDVQERLAGLGVEIVGSTPDQFKGFMKSEDAKWAKVVKATGLTAD